MGQVSKVVSSKEAIIQDKSGGAQIQLGGAQIPREQLSKSIAGTHTDIIHHEQISCTDRFRRIDTYTDKSLSSSLSFDESGLHLNFK